MRLFIKIILIILLVVFLSTSIWFFCLRIFLADVHFKRAIQYQNGENWPKALNHYNKVLFYQGYESFYQVNFAIDLRKGLDFYKNKEAKIQIINLAINVINKISQQDIGLKVVRDLTQIYITKASLTQNLDDFLTADKIFQEAIEFSPKMAGIYSDWCQLKIEQQDWQTALEMCEKAINLYPEIKPETSGDRKVMIKTEMSGVYERIGQIYFNKENYKKSEQMYIEALRLVPIGRPNIWKKIADIYYKQGDLDTAIQRNLHGMALSPGDSTWPLVIGLLYDQKDDTIEAKKYFQQVLDINPDNKIAQQFLIREGIK